MKAKQWIKDYVDFAMPLIMAIVALNLVDLLIDLPYAYKPATYKPQIGDLLKTDALLSVFMQQVNEGRLFLYSLIYLGVALFLRLFTNRLSKNIGYPFRIIALIYIIVYGFVTIKGKSYIWTFAFIIVDLIIIYIYFLLSFSILKMFFINFPIIKNFSYIAISILGLSTLLIYQFGTPNIFLIAKWVLLISIFSLIIISIFGYFTLRILKRNSVKIPQDIIEWETDTILNSEQGNKDIMGKVVDMIRKL